MAFIRKDTRDKKRMIHVFEAIKFNKTHHHPPRLTHLCSALLSSLPFLLLSQVALVSMFIHHWELETGIRCGITHF